MQTFDFEIYDDYVEEYLDCSFILKDCEDEDGHLYSLTVYDSEDGSTITFKAGDPYTVTLQMNSVFGHPIPPEYFMKAMRHYQGRD